MSSRRMAHHDARSAKRARGLAGERRRKFSGGSTVRLRGKSNLKLTKRFAQRVAASRARMPTAQTAPDLRWEKVSAIALLVYAVCWCTVIAGFVTS